MLINVGNRIITSQGNFKIVFAAVFRPLVMYGGGSSDEEEDEYSQSRGSSQTRDRNSLERDEKAQMTEERRAKLREIEVRLKVIH